MNGNEEVKPKKKLIWKSVVVSLYRTLVVKITLIQDRILIDSIKTQWQVHQKAVYEVTVFHGEGLESYWQEQLIWPL